MRLTEAGPLILILLIYRSFEFSNHGFIRCADMTRQYKTMQMQLENRIEVLEGMMRKLQLELGMYVSYCNIMQSL